MQSTLTSQSRIATLSDKHCVFQCGDSLFSLPATAVREVTIMPPVVRVPLSHRALAGIGNVRSEFLPVIALAPIVGDQARLTDPSTGQLLVVASQFGCWSIAIDRVVAIDALETHVDAGQRNENSDSVLLGTATHRGKVISVLDANGLQRMAQQILEGHWARTESLFTSNLTETTSASESHAK
ncbi:chemotaxis protein CheW [Roseiconus nitratireducens]|uniref:Chemotaxis protein CheW n=1 Tax=Roseiconus nitratireducens TaxID=2605748 RepID=A0A5M6DAL0_9BACT|nr:chemotaxis protein CheW [Roseiconus nitratireducens]KAA5544604.1 chemotaxis protein CheW [Roseiconus nitratireducens]